MGGRGGKSGFSSRGGGRPSALDMKAPEQVIESYYRRSGSYYGLEVISVKSESNGEIVLTNLKPEFEGGSYSKANTIPVTYKFKHGITDTGKRKESYGINWDNVKAVSGATYSLRGWIKEKGFVWDRDNKRWIRK